MVLGAVGLTQVATTRSHIEQSLSIPRKKFSKWQWFLECSPEAFPTKKVLDHLWLQKKLVFHFIVVLGAVGLTQVATARSHIEQSPLIPKKNISKWQWFLDCSPGAFPTKNVLDHLCLQKKLGFSFYSGPGCCGPGTGGPLQEATLNSFINSKEGVSKWHWFLECSSGPFPT